MTAKFKKRDDEATQYKKALDLKNDSLKELAGEEKKLQQIKANIKRKKDEVESE